MRWGGRLQATLEGTAWLSGALLEIQPQSILYAPLRDSHSGCGGYFSCADLGILIEGLVLTVTALQE